MITPTWLAAIKQIMTVLNEQSLPTLASDGSINPQSYAYQPTGSRAVFPFSIFTDYRRINYCWEGMDLHLQQTD
jgi:hypothetical protein